MSEERGNDAAGYLGWFFLGAIAGAAAAVLLTPKTGRETRELLAEHSGDLFKRAQDAAGQAQDRAGDLFDKGREYFEEQAQRLTSAFEAGRSAMKEEITRGRSRNRSPADLIPEVELPRPEELHAPAEKQFSGPRSLLPRRGGAAPDRHRDVVGLDPGPLRADLLVQPGAGRDRRGAHPQRLLPALPAPLHARRPPLASPSPPWGEGRVRGERGRGASPTAENQPGWAAADRR